MGERKVLNKYIPADFDPQLVPRGKKPKDDLIPVRMMLPFSIQCSSCSSFLYRGRKFNSKKEPVKGVDGKYLGIQRFRFYIKCSECSRPITFLTDPKNADYEMESGGTRNYEVWHDERKTNEQFEKDVEEDEKMDSMKALENRVLESQREMAELDALEEIRAMNARHINLMRGKRGGGELYAAQAVLDAREANLGLGHAEEEEELNENGLTHDEEELVKSIKFGVGNGLDGTTAIIHRLDEEDEILAEKKIREEAEALILKKRQNEDVKSKSNVPVFKVKRKKRKDAEDDGAKRSKTADSGGKEPPVAVPVASNEKETKSSNSTGGPLSGLLGYGSDSDSN
ncbi:hypothetical protein HJC23_002646 [Cyclotella cryptica]|uniref:Splicing factor YJU2 n=1 Tax=Cyclotella cryptica TaxID=29204 RepID=A0ABD3PLH3_9STRA|eukprot:CCRYP_013533-RA/>CCRYP_013533-RA protein AED:0.00 eAED:0.00 QI:131/-1/1/1/-1/1/1/43/340